MKVKRKYLTPEETAQAFGRSLDGIYASIKKKEIPAIRMGRRFYIPISFVRGDEAKVIEH